jgi:uncharacterized protein YbaR (Trm112 family)
MLAGLTPKSKTGERKAKLANPQLAHSKTTSALFFISRMRNRPTPTNKTVCALLRKLRGVYPPFASFATNLDSTSPPLLQSTFTTGAFMPIPKDLLDILVCPECKTPLHPLTDAASGLQCETCRRIYPIRDDIPVLIIDQATKAPD